MLHLEEEESRVGEYHTRISWTLTDSPSRSGMALPVEVIGIIAAQLIADSEFGTCGALNRTCHAVHAQTLPVLYRICVFWASNILKTLPPDTWSTNDLPVDQDPHKDAKEDVSHQWDVLKASPGARYIEYVPHS
jgi:hypothetical protein